MTSATRTTLALLLFAAGLSTAYASSDDAWETFRADVTEKCLAATAVMLDNATAVVDPFGSEHFGLAIVQGRPKGADGTVSHICVYDKATKAAEIGSELTEDMLKGTK